MREHTGKQGAWRDSSVARGKGRLGNGLGSVFLDIYLCFCEAHTISKLKKKMALCQGKLRLWVVLATCVNWSSHIGFREKLREWERKRERERDRERQRERGSRESEIKRTRERVTERKRIVWRERERSEQRESEIKRARERVTERKRLKERAEDCSRICIMCLFMRVFSLHKQTQHLTTVCNLLPPASGT